jgi:hypothetical protein
METIVREDIVHDGALLAFVLRAGTNADGLKFYSRDTDFIQIGTWHYNAGQKLKAHIHKEFSREAQRTQEVVIVKKGAMRSTIFTPEEKPLTSVMLHEGDILVCLAGGHDFQIMDDHTEIIEIKNGPFFGVEKDKKIIERQGRA